MKSVKRILGIILCLCMIMQVASVAVLANDDYYVHVIYDSLSAKAGSDFIYEQADSVVKDKNQRKSLVYTSDEYDGVGYDPRNAAVVEYKNLDTDEIYEDIQDSYPLKCIEEYNPSMGKYGRYDLEFVVPKDLKKGTYSITIKLDVPQGKLEWDIVKPAHFVIEKIYINGVKPTPGGGGGVEGDDDDAGDDIAENSEIIFNVADTTTLAPIKGAQITLADESGEVNETFLSNENGVASAKVPNGIYNVQVLATGYQVRMFTVEKTDDQFEFSPYLNKNPLVQVETSVKEMTKQEMVDAGIDVDAAENKHIYKCVTVLKFKPVAEGGSVDIVPIELNFDYVCDEAGTIIKAEPKHQDGMVIHPVAKDVYLIIHSEVTWIKEIFDVQLVVANTSAIEKIKNCEITLDLPEGLSLATMTGEQQQLNVEIEEISPLETDDVHWYVCGDVAGEYIIGGNIAATREGGGITENFSNDFTVKEPMVVLAGDAMKLLIEAEKYATAGLPYKVNYTLQNVSGKTLYDVALNVLGGKFCEEYSIEQLKHNGELINLEGLSGTFNNGYELKDEEFESGEILSGTFEIIFGQGIETDYTEYMVSQMFTFTGDGSTTTIPTEVVLVDVVCNHSFDDGVVSTLPTEDEEGVRTFTCGVCGTTMEMKIPKLLKQNLYFTWGDVSSHMYNGADEEIYKKVTCDTKDGGDITYSSGNEEVATVDNEGKLTILKAGETVITATAAAAEKYVETSASYTLTVEKAPLTITANNVSVEYGKQLNNKKFGYKAEGLKGTDTTDVILGAAEYTTDYEPLSGVGEYSISVSGLEADSYDITFVNGKVTVKKATEYKIAFNNLRQRFGNVTDVTAKVLPEDETAEFLVEYKVGKNWVTELPEKTGKYQVRAKLTSSENIVASSEYVEANFEILESVLISGTDGGALGVDVIENGDELEYVISDSDVTAFIDNVPESGQVVFDITGTENSVKNLVLPSNIIDAFYERGKVKELTIISEATEISVDKDVLRTLANNVGENEKIRINVEKVEVSTLSEKQQEAIRAISENATVLQLNVDVLAFDNRGNIEEVRAVHELNGDVEVCTAFEAPEETENQVFVVYYVSDNGKLEYVITEYADGFITFITEHFSHYILTTIECEHEWGKSKVIKEATTTATGIKRYTCTLCGVTRDDKIPKVTGSSGGAGGSVAVDTAGITYLVKFNTYGGSQINDVKVKANDTVAVPETPEKRGYIFAGWYSNMGLTEEYDFSKKVTKAFTLYAKWEVDEAFVNAVVPAETPSAGFKDVVSGAWYESAVKFVNDNGFMKGMTEETFAPDETLTRAMFVTVLYRMEKEPEVTGETFADVAAGSWYENAVKWAVEKGIVNGVTETEFAPDNTITREQMSTIIYRYASFKGYNTEVSDALSYTDNSAIADYAQNAIIWSNAKGIMSGNADGSFAPKSSATRAQAAAVFMRIVENLK